jgi:hypothetical protein
MEQNRISSYKEVKKKLKKFIYEHTGIKDIDLYRRSYEIPYLNKDFMTIITIIYDFEGDKKFNILIRSKENPNDICLLISLNKNSSFYINLVETQDKTCNLPTSRAGTWIMHLIDQLAMELGISYIYLFDESNVKCDRYRVSLTLMRIYNGGRSWYENFGYKPEKLEKEEYDQLINDYISTPIETVLEDIRKFVLMEDKLEIIEPLEGETLGKYMTYLSNHDCEMYYDLERYFGKLRYLENPPEWIGQRMLIEQCNKFSKHML